MHFVPFPGASPFLTATVLRPPSGQLPPPQYVYPVAYGGPVFGQRGCRRALPRAGRESGEHGSRGLWRMQWLWPVGPREGGVSMHAEHAAGHDSLPYRDRTAADGLSEIAPLCEDGRSKKSLCPVWGHRQEKQAGEGEFWGKPSRIDSRDATGWRPQAVPVSGKDASRDHRQRGGGSETQRRWRYGPDGHRRQDAG